MKERLLRTGCFGKSKDEQMKKELYSSGFLCRGRGNFVLMFQDKVSFPSSRVKNKKRKPVIPLLVYIVNNVGGGKFSVVHGG
jgi:hypothetical protein